MESNCSECDCQSQSCFESDLHSNYTHFGFFHKTEHIWHVSLYFDNVCCYLVNVVSLWLFMTDCLSLCSLEMFWSWIKLIYDCACRSWLIDSRGIAKKVKNASQSSAHQIKDCGANRECPNCHYRIDNSDVSWNTGAKKSISLVIIVNYECGWPWFVTLIFICILLYLEGWCLHYLAKIWHEWD